LIPLPASGTIDPVRGDRLLVIGFVAAAGTTGCGPAHRCTFFDESVTGPEPSERSAAFRALGDPDEVDDVHGFYSGLLVNLSTQASCAFAIWHFSEVPDVADIPAVVPGDTPPVQLPGGGRLNRHGLLPLAGEHEFAVSITEPGEFGIDLGDGSVRQPEMDVSVVIAFCEEADVSMQIQATMTACRAVEDAAPLTESGFSRLW
jgi:hypothetical protein